MHIQSITCVKEITPDNEYNSSVLLNSYSKRRLTWQTRNIKDTLQRKYKEKRFMLIGVCELHCKV